MISIILNILQLAINKENSNHLSGYLFDGFPRNINQADLLSNLLDNLKIQNNIIEIAWRENIKKLLFLGSSCIYPKFAKQPIKEGELLTGSLETTNQWYAIAKISGVKLCESLRKQYKKDYISLMPTNLYGYNDNFDLDDIKLYDIVKVEQCLDQAYDTVPGHARKLLATSKTVWINGRRAGRFGDPFGDNTVAFPCNSRVAGCSPNVFIGA